MATPMHTSAIGTMESRMHADVHWPFTQQSQSEWKGAGVIQKKPRIQKRRQRISAV